MHIKFRITYEDGTFLESHDPMWNIVKDHCHALPPDNNKRWVQYDLISDDLGPLVGVNFQTGLFMIKGNLLHPAYDGAEALTFKTDPQEFPVDENRKFLNGLPYFPIYGRKIYKGDWGESMLFFCGWKRKEGDKTIEKIAYVYPNGQIVMS